MKKIKYLAIALALALSFSLVTAVPALAAPVVASVTETAFGTDTTDHYVDMPATVNAGDLLIALFTNDGDATVTTPAGWTELASNETDGAVRLSVYYKIAAGTEGGTTVNLVTSATEQAAAQVYRITDWQGTTPPEISTAATDTSTAPDPAFLDPAGWGVSNTLWLAVAGQDRGDQPGTLAYPISYTDGISTQSSSGVGVCRTHSARRVLLTATSEDPGPFTIPVTEQWVAFTIAVRPASCDLTISSTEEGSVTEPGEGVFPCDEGTIVDLVATPGAGSWFVEWTGDVGTLNDVNAAATTITMYGNYSITAEFVKQYDLTISSTGGGSVTEPGEDTFTYNEGEVVDLIAEAGEGYLFVEWTGDVGTIADVYAAATNITMNDDYSITANFEAAYPTVTTQAATNITANSATLNMNYTVGDFSPVQVRFAYKKSAGLFWSNTDWVSKSGSGTYAAPLTGLDSNTEYDFIAQLKHNYTEIEVEGTTLQFTTDTPPTPPPSGGCFIATAAYGTPTAEQIDVLREFRDVVLLKSTAGSQFVALYYQLSPPIADFIAGNELLRTLIRELLVDPIVWVVESTGDMWRN